MSQGPGAPTVVSAARLKDNSGKRPLARQLRGQKYAVVARVWLAPDHGNVEAVGSPRNELLDRSHSRHSVADGHQPRSLQAVDAHAHTRDLPRTVDLRM
jgi:hypothetical protein